MTRNIKWFEDFKETSSGANIYLGTGASIHMTGNIQWFEDFKETSSGANIYLGDDRGYQIKGYGNIPVVFPDGIIRHIHNVMYILWIEKNLISVSTMTSQNLKEEVYKSYCVIKDLLDPMKPIALGIHVGGFYKLNVKTYHIRHWHHLP